MRRHVLLLALLASACGGTDESPAPPSRVEGPPLAVTGDLRPHPLFPSGFVPPHDVRVWLPPGYDTPQGASRYPVVYVQDGEQLFDPGTAPDGVDWGLDEWMDRLIADGEARPTIVVAIAATDRRREEYLPAKAVAEPGPVSPGMPGEPPIGPALESDAYLLFLVQELKPFIDRTYRTLPGRPDTFVMGAGLGGLLALYAVTEFPDVFGAAIALAPRWTAADGAFVDHLGSALPAAGAHRFYLDQGTDSTDARVVALRARVDSLLRAKGYEEGRSVLHPAFAGADETPRTLRTRIQHPMRFLLGR